MCHQHRPQSINTPAQEKESHIRLSASIPYSLNHLIELVRLETGNDKVEIIRQILWQYFRTYRTDLLPAELENETAKSPA